MGPGAAVDYARVLSVLDEAWASATLPDDDLPRAPGVAAVLDKDGEDIFDRAWPVMSMGCRDIVWHPSPTVSRLTHGRTQLDSRVVIARALAS